MGIFIKEGDSAQYYQPELTTDSGTDRVDEIAVGSDGGGRGYLTDSGARDTTLGLSVTERRLKSVPQGFAYLLGASSGVWAGAGHVRLRLSGSDMVMLKDYLTDKELTSENYTFAFFLTVADKAGNMADISLEAGTGTYDSELGKYRCAVSLPTDVLDFGTTGAGTPLKDLSGISVYLRGYVHAPGAEMVEYVGGGVEVGSTGGSAPFRLRGIAGLDWSLTLPSGVTADAESGHFATGGVSFMPETERIVLTVESSQESGVALRGLFVEVMKSGGVVTDCIPISQETGRGSALGFSMRTVRLKSLSERTLNLTVTNKDKHTWNLSESPDWVDFPTLRSAEESQKVSVTFARNGTGHARYGNIVIYDVTDKLYYQIPCVQWGTESCSAVEGVTADGRKEVSAYAATIAKSSFTMEAAFYNAPSFTLYVRQLGFDIKDFSAGTDGLATLNMKSGACAGRDFRITATSYDAEHDRWRLTLDRLEDSSLGMVFPNTMYPIEAGDRFVLTDILMPEVYVFAAERRLLAKARAYYDRNSRLRYLYDLEIDSKWVRENGGVRLRPGMYMQIYDADLIGENPEYALIDTVTITGNESNIPTFKVTLRDRLYLPE